MDNHESENSISSVSVEEYYAEEFFEREKQSVWSRSWLLVGRANDIPDPGDFIVFDLELMNTSVIIVRGRDSVIRAFHNACVHQGAKLTHERKGHSPRFRCPFHGWLYNFEGKLAGVPLKRLFRGLEFNELRLKPVVLDVWGGFIFLHLGESPQYSLRETLQPLPEQLEAYLQNEDWRWHAGYKGLYKANWKIFVDNQSEGHHASFLHSQSIGGRFKPEDIPHTVYPDSPGVMVKIEVLRPESSSPGSVKQTAVSRIARKFSHHGMWTEKDGRSVAQSYPGALNRKKSPRWVFDLYVVFPNVVFLFEDDQFVIQRIWPLTANLTTWELDHFFVGKPKDFGDLFNRELSLLQQLDTASEDTSLSEGIHKNYLGGAVKTAYLSDLQKGTLAFQQRVRAMAERGKGHE